MHQIGAESGVCSRPSRRSIGRALIGPDVIDESKPLFFPPLMSELSKARGDIRDLLLQRPRPPSEIISCLAWDLILLAEKVKVFLETHNRWLFVFDNAQDALDLKPYLPDCRGGHVIITSRNPSRGNLARAVSFWNCSSCSISTFYSPA